MPTLPSTPTAACARCGRPVEPGEHLCAQCREEVGPAAAAAPPAARVTREPRMAVEPHRGSPSPGPGPGTDVDLDAAEDQTDLERRRNRWPSTMVRPSPVQYHATIFVTIVLVLAGLAVWAWLGHRGVGPFDAKIARVGQFHSGTQTIVVGVENKGSRSSKATCTFRALDGSGTQIATTTFLTDPIPGHTTADVTQVFRGLPTEPAGYDAVCS